MKKGYKIALEIIKIVVTFLLGLEVGDGTVSNMISGM